MVDQNLDTLINLMNQMMAQMKPPSQGTPTESEGSTK